MAECVKATNSVFGLTTRASAFVLRDTPAEAASLQLLLRPRRLGPQVSVFSAMLSIFFIFIAICGKWHLFEKTD